MKRKFLHVAFKSCEDQQLLGRTGIAVTGKPGDRCNHAGYNATLVLDPHPSDASKLNQQTYGFANYWFFEQEDFTHPKWQRRLVCEAHFTEELEVLGEIEVEL